MVFLGAYSDVLRTYCGILELDLHELEFNASFGIFKPTTQVHGDQVPKRHYRLIKTSL